MLDSMIVLGAAATYSHTGLLCSLVLHHLGSASAAEYLILPAFSYN
jgi:hypothetical protein